MAFRSVRAAESQIEYTITGANGTSVSLNNAFFSDNAQFTSGNLTPAIMIAAMKKDSDFIKAMIRYEIDRALFGVGEARRHLVEVDPQARVALTAFAEATRLSDLSKLASKSAH